MSLIPKSFRKLTADDIAEDELREARLKALEHASKAEECEVDAKRQQDNAQHHQRQARMYTARVARLTSKDAALTDERQLELDVTVPGRTKHFTLHHATT